MSLRLDSVKPTNAGFLLWVNLIFDPRIYTKSKIGGREVMFSTLSPASLLQFSASSARFAYWGV